MTDVAGSTVEPSSLAFGGRSAEPGDGAPATIAEWMLSESSTAATLVDGPDHRHLEPRSL